MDMAAATRLSKRLSAAGFLGLGGFHPLPEDRVPDAGADRPARTVLMIGSAGPAFWQAFQNAPEAGDGIPHPMDRFTRRVLTDIADEAGLVPVFAFDGPPYHPFQRWAMRCGGFSQSPIGVLAHRRYGPWIGLRAALVADRHFGEFEAAGTTGPCPECVEKPCLSACPVEAFSLASGYDVAKCRNHVVSASGTDCLTGCLSRRACPVGQDHAPLPDQGRFHMRTFVGQ
ncbi:MAG: hypothetical protein JJ902_11165 [Roseibium sp.]|nr:hypothetical protein [Roseibium sp.]